jgi:hypothetical protein
MISGFPHPPTAFSCANLVGVSLNYNLVCKGYQECERLAR